MAIAHCWQREIPLINAHAAINLAFIKNVEISSGAAVAAGRASRWRAFPRRRVIHQRAAKRQTSVRESDMPVYCFSRRIRGRTPAGREERWLIRRPDIFSQHPGVFDRRRVGGTLRSPGIQINKPHSVRARERRRVAKTDKERK